MKSRQLAGLIVGAMLNFPALAGDVGVSISVGQPGFYGRLDIGGYPAPALIYREPIVIVPGPVYAPIAYLRVPPGHRKRWSHYCGHYGACGQRVYFVRDDWYVREYVPHYHRHHYHHHHAEHVVYRDRDEERGGHHHKADKHKDERGHGHGNKHGRGHGHGRDLD